MTDLEGLAQVKGLTPSAVCEELCLLAGQVPADQAIVELGVYKGRSACYLAAGSLAGDGAHVWAIDPWDLPGDRRPFGALKPRRRKHWVEFTTRETRLAAKRNVHRNGFREHVTLVRGFSVTEGERWDGPPVGLLYVDGDHRADAVRADFEAWRPHLAPDATVAFDDYAASHGEVIEAVDALVADCELAGLEVLHGRLAVARLSVEPAPKEQALARAAELGVKVRSNAKLETILQRIAEAE